MTCGLKKGQKQTHELQGCKQESLCFAGGLERCYMDGCFPVCHHGSGFVGCCDSGACRMPDVSLEAWATQSKVIHVSKNSESCDENCNLEWLRHFSSAGLASAGRFLTRVGFERGVGQIEFLRVHFPHSDSLSWIWLLLWSPEVISTSDSLFSCFDNISALNSQFWSRSNKTSEFLWVHIRLSFILDECLWPCTDWLSEICFHANPQKGKMVISHVFCSI